MRDEEKTTDQLIAEVKALRRRVEELDVSRDQGRRAEEALKIAAREWQTTFDAVSDAVWLLDKDYRIQRGNKATAKFLNKEPGEVMGRHCWVVVHGISKPLPECPGMRMGKTFRRESFVIAVGQRWLEVSVDPVLDAGGNLQGAVHVIQDFTERKRAGEERSLL